MPPTAPDDLVARVREARARPDEAVLEGFHAVKHALRFGADLRLVATSDADALEGLAAALAPDLAGAFRSARRSSRASSSPPSRRARRRPASSPSRRRPVVDPAVAARGRPGAGRAARGPAPPRQRRRGGAGRRRGRRRRRAHHGRARSLGPDGPAGLRRPALRAPRRAASRVLEPAGRPLVALDPGGAPLEPGGLPERALLAFGTERHGLSAGLLARAALRVAIPMRPGVSSLNLATAVAVGALHGRPRPAGTLIRRPTSRRSAASPSRCPRRRRGRPTARRAGACGAPSSRACARTGSPWWSRSTRRRARSCAPRSRSRSSSRRHYHGYPTLVLVRLAAIAEDELAEVLAESWRRVAPAKLLRDYDEAHPPPGDA